MDSSAFFAALAILALILVAVWLRNRNVFHLLFCLVFGIYLIGVVGVVVFPFPIGYDAPTFKPNINLIPFDFGSCDPRSRALCFEQIYQNVLLTIPFGFAVNFIACVKPKNVLWLALAVGFVFELTQLVISIIVRSPFRTVDINDLILNAAGVLLGYGIFRIFGAIYFRIIRKLQLQPRHIFAYIHNIIRHQN